jgi:hypothetical protein
MRNVEAIADLDSQLRTIFGARLQSLVVHGTEAPHDTPVATLAVVDRLTTLDLVACAGMVATWHRRGLATPLILSADEFARSLDAFPFEFGAIMADHELVTGRNPFADLAVNPMDLRRACEVQARSHLLHMREAYIETAGRPDAIADLVVRSASPLAALLKNVALLPRFPETGATLRRVSELSPAGTISADEAHRLFPDYLAAVEDLVSALDRWSAA